MGIHFLNPELIAPVPDPMRPDLLLYEPNGDKLRLVGAEWFIPLSTGVKERPTLLGQPFDGPMEGHEPLMPHGIVPLRSARVAVEREPGRAVQTHKIPRSHAQATDIPWLRTEPRLVPAAAALTGAADFARRGAYRFSPPAA